MSNQAERKEPSKHARPWALLMVGLLVGSVVWLGPVIGAIAVPGYFPLTDAIPADIRSIVMPVVSAVIGFSAALFEFYLSDRYSLRFLRRFVILPSLCTAIALALLVRSLFLDIARVSYNGGRNVEAFVIGHEDRPKRCEELCKPLISDSQCIKNLTMDPANISACWGDARIRDAQFFFVTYYLCFMFSISCLVAVVRARKFPKSPHVNTSTE